MIKKTRKFSIEFDLNAAPKLYWDEAEKFAFFEICRFMAYIGSIKGSIRTSQAGGFKTKAFGNTQSEDSWRPKRLERHSFIVTVPKTVTREHIEAGILKMLRAEHGEHENVDYAAQRLLVRAS